MPKFKLFIAICILLFSISAEAQTLWRGAIYGMSVTQVQEAFQTATAPVVDVGSLGSGAEELLRLNQVRLVNHDFIARFYFKDQKLVQVTLSLKEDHTFDSGMLIFESLSEALRVKYGTEINKEINRGILNNAIATWLSGRTNISLFTAAIRGGQTILNVNYQVRIAQDADKL